MKPAIVLLTMLVAVSFVTLAQTKGLPHSRASTLAALDRADQALNDLQSNLAALRNFPEVLATADANSQNVLAGRRDVAWLRSKVSVEGTIDPSEFAVVIYNLDIAAINAVRVSELLTTEGAITGNQGKQRAALALRGKVEQLKNARDELLQVIDVQPKNLSEAIPPPISSDNHIATAFVDISLFNRSELRSRTDSRRLVEPLREQPQFDIGVPVTVRNSDGRLPSADSVVPL